MKTISNKYMMPSRKKQLSFFFVCFSPDQSLQTHNFLFQTIWPHGDQQQLMQCVANHPQEIFIPDDISVINHAQPPKNRQADHRFGGMHINYLLYFFIPLLIFACILTYHQAVKKKEEPPFPHATITNTACHYPQDIAFRYFMLPAGGFINLVYFSIFRWLEQVKKDTEYPGSIYSWMLPIGQISTFGFLAAIGTIDGNGYPIIHDIGAIFFFIMLFLLAVTITLVVRDIHQWDSSAITRQSNILKLFFAGYLVGMAVYCGIYALREQNSQNDDDPVVVILEWNLVFFGLAWLMTFRYDWTHVFLTLRGDFSATMKRLSLSHPQ